MRKHFFSCKYYVIIFNKSYFFVFLHNFREFSLLKKHVLVEKTNTGNNKVCFDIDQKIYITNFQ